MKKQLELKFLRTHLDNVTLGSKIIEKRYAILYSFFSLELILKAIVAQSNNKRFK